MEFKKYKLTESQLIQIARLCVQEQGGSEAGTKAEASQGANLLETNFTYQKKYGDDIYNMFKTSGWYYKASYFFENGYASPQQIEWVRDVLVNGNRTLPGYVDEHDCLSDIASISTGSVRNKNDYMSGITVIKNKMGSTYTFYCFPAPGCDPFGYTDSAYKKVISGDIPSGDSTVSPLSIKIAKKGDKGENVRMIQTMLKALGFMTGNIDGKYGDQTEQAVKVFQSVHDLSQDGKVTLNTKRKLIADYKKVFGLGIAEKREAALRGKYTVTASSLNLRDGAGTSGNIITAMKNGSIMTTKGYYTDIDGVKWYYVMFTDSDGKNYCGFASSQYLNKIG